MALIAPVKSASALLANSPVTSWVKLLDPNDLRKRFWFQNQDAATNAFLNTKTGDQGSLLGFKVPPGQAFIDDPPCVHTGEWWVAWDVAVTTQLVFTETI